MIHSAGSPGQILQLLDDHGASINPVHMAVGLNWIAKKAGQLTAADLTRLQDFVQCLEYECINMDARSLSTLSWAIVKLHSKVGMTSLAAATASAATAKMEGTTSRSLSSIIWSLSKVHLVDKRLLAAAASHACDIIHDFDAHSLSSLAYGFAKVQEKNADLMSKVARRTRSCLGDMTIQGICNIAWSFARLGVRDELMMQDIATAAVNKHQSYGKMKWVDWGTLLSAFAALGIHSEALFDLCESDEFVRELDSANRWSICALSAASSKLGLERLGGEVERQVRRRRITKDELQRDFLDPASWTRP